MKDTTPGEEIQLQNLEEARAILGPLDSNARLIRELLGVNLLVRGDALRLMGRMQDVSQVRQVLEVALASLRSGKELGPSDVADQLRALSTPAAKTTSLEGNGQMRVKARSPGQKRYLQALAKHDVVFAMGPAGTGKTYLAVAAAVQAAREGSVRRIVLVRPAVEAGEKLGFLPGDFQAKVDPYMRPLYDALHDLLEPGQRMRYLEGEIIEVCPLAYMRGRTLNESFVILDEAQNTTVPQMLMFLSRLGEGSRMVVTGDPSQVDLPPQVQSGLVDAVQRLAKIDGIHITRLEKGDIVRHDVVQRILRAYEQES